MSVVLAIVPECPSGCLSKVVSLVVISEQHKEGDVCRRMCSGGKMEGRPLSTEDFGILIDVLGEYRNVRRVVKGTW